MTYSACSKLVVAVTAIALLVTCSCKRQPASKAVGAIQEEPKVEQAVLAYLKLSDSAYGTEKERTAIVRLEGELENSIGVASAGEYDGNEFGGGYVTLYMYGPDADTLFEVIIDTIRQYKPREGSYIIKRYGAPGEREEKVVL